jgi:hypothetical protein
LIALLPFKNPIASAMEDFGGMDNYQTPIVLVGYKMCFEAEVGCCEILPTLIAK